MAQGSGSQDVVYAQAKTKHHQCPASSPKGKHRDARGYKSPTNRLMFKGPAMMRSRSLSLAVAAAVIACVAISYPMRVSNYFHQSVHEQ